MIVDKKNHANEANKQSALLQVSISKEATQTRPVWEYVSLPADERINAIAIPSVNTNHNDA